MVYIFALFYFLLKDIKIAAVLILKIDDVLENITRYKFIVRKSNIYAFFKVLRIFFLLFMIT